MLTFYRGSKVTGENALTFYQRSKVTGETVLTFYRRSKVTEVRDKWDYGSKRIYQEVKGWWERKEL